MIERFRDWRYFLNFAVHTELGTLTWNNEIDVAPETLYSAATGTPLQEWMAAEQVAAA